MLINYYKIGIRITSCSRNFHPTRKGKTIFSSSYSLATLTSTRNLTLGLLSPGGPKYCHLRLWPAQVYEIHFLQPSILPERSLVFRRN